MTKVTYRNNGRDFELKLEGHADYDSEGKDIVCSSISTISYLVTDELLIHLDSVLCDYSFESGNVKINAHARNDTGMTICKVLFNAAVRTLKSLVERYPDNVSFIS